MSTSIFFDPPILARRVYAGEVRVVDDIKFWNKITKVVYSRIHSDDNNLNFQVEDATKEINFYTNQITFHDGDGDQLGYIDATGTIHGLTIDGHATEGDFGDLEDRVEVLEGNIETISSNISILYTNVAVLEANVETLEGNVETLHANISTLSSNITDIEGHVSVLFSNVEYIEGNISLLFVNVETLESNM